MLRANKYQVFLAITITLTGYLALPAHKPTAAQYPALPTAFSITPRTSPLS